MSRAGEIPRESKVRHTQARLVAYQLGHSRPSMTQDVYLARRAVAPRPLAGFALMKMA
jgi:integrase